MTPTSRALPPLRVLALVALSGAAALVYEVLFFRALALLFGVSAQAVGAVVGAFLLGLGAGAALGPSLLRRWRPWSAFAACELAIAAFAALSPVILAWLRGLAQAGELWTQDPGAPPLLAAVLAFALLAWPTFWMGATFPLVASAVGGGDSARTSRVAWIYGANTAGACAGSLLAAFVLLPRGGLPLALGVAAGVNVLVALGALAIGRRTGADGDERHSAALDAASAASAADLAPPPVALLGIVALVGAASVALQVLANRLMSELLGGAVYVFATILAVFLGGLALGAPFGGRIIVRSAQPMRTLGWLAAAFGASVGLSLALLRWKHEFPSVFGEDLLAGATNLPLVAGPVRPTEFTPLDYLELALGHTAIALLLPTFLTGAFFPAACHFALEGIDATRGAARVGRLYLWNTLGSLAGSLAAAYVLLPKLSLRVGFALVIALAFAAAVLAWLADARADDRAPRSSLARSGIALSVLLACAALPFVPGDPPGTKYGERTLFFGESAASSAKVIEVDDVAEELPVRCLFVSGKPVASSIFIDRRLQILLGSISSLAHPDARKQLCIGLGTGMTSGALAVAGGELEVVELSSAVLEAEPLFARWNGALSTRDDVRLIHDDGRAYLARSRERYDVISADPIDPVVAGSAYLYTDEYYRLGREHLAPRGVMSQWVPLYDLSLADIAGIVRTFRGVFEHVTAWVTGYDLVLVGSREPFELDPAAIEARIERDEALRALLADVAVHDADDLLACCFATNATLDAFAELAPRANTDDHPWIEFHAPLAAFGTYPLEVYRRLASASDDVPLAAHVDATRRARIRASQATLKQAALAFADELADGAGFGEARTRYIARLRAASPKR